MDTAIDIQKSMTDETQNPNAFKGFPSRASWFLVRLIWLGGFLLPVALGLGAIAILRSRGIATMGLAEGLVTLIPLILLVEIPFAVLALIVGKVLKNAQPNKPPSLTALMFVSGGALLGLVAALGYDLMGSFLFEGDFRDVVGMMLALWMFTIPWLLTIGAFGIIMGGFAGAIFWIGMSLIISRC